MDVREPRPRHRGYFLQSDTVDYDSPDHDNPEGLDVRVRRSDSTRGPQQSRGSAVRGSRPTSAATSESRTIERSIRSTSGTGSRLRVHRPR
jgi:hypothetical protein